MYEASQLTGAQVMEVRTRHGLSRDAFSALAGFTGKSSARLNNIEKKDSWKPGDREAIARLLNGIEDGTVTVSAPTTRSTSTKTKSPRSTGAVLKPIVIDTVTLRDGTTITVDQLRVTPLDADGCLPTMPVIATESPSAEFVDLVQEDDLLVLVSPYDSTLAPLVTASAATTQSAGLPAHYARHHVFDVQPTPDVHAFSNSELQTWKTCRRKWWLAWYRQLQLQAQSFSDVRATGTRVHRALEAWYVPDGEPRVDPRTALERIVVEDWTSITELAARRGVDDEHLAALAVEFTSATNLERAMIEGYVQWLAETGVDADLRVIASETPIIVNVQVDVDDEWHDIQLIGLLDVRARRVTDDVLTYLDHKTVGDLSGPVHTLPQNEQILHYLLLEYLSVIEEEVRSRRANESSPGETYIFRTQPTSPVALSLLSGTDHAVGGTSAVDHSSQGREPVQQRTQQPRTVSLGMPQFTSQQGREASSAQVGGTSSSAQRVGQEARSRYSQMVGGVQGENVTVDEGLVEEATRAAFGRVSSGALYNMIRRVKRSQRAKPPFYARIEVRHNAYELEAYKTRALATIRDILRTKKALDNGASHLDVVYPSPNGNCTWSCDFFVVCNMFDDGSRSEDMLTGLYRTGNPRARYEKKG